MSKRRRSRPAAEEMELEEEVETRAPRARRTTARKTYAEEDEDDFEDMLSAQSPSDGSDNEGAAGEGGALGSGYQLAVDKILGRRMVPVNEGDKDGEKQEMFLVKWKGYSYLHVSWETLADIKKVDHTGAQRVRRFFTSPQYALQQELEREDGDNDHIEYFDPDFAEIQRIIACDRPDCRHRDAQTLQQLKQIIQTEDEEMGEVMYLVKWTGLPYNEATWEKWGDIKEDGVYAVFEFWQRQQPPEQPSLGNNQPSLEQYQKLTESPRYAVGGLTLREYQLEGVNWLLWNWWHKRACILADEMGLGKTIQAVSFIQQLRSLETTQLRGPFLVVAPLSLLNQWQSEIATWAPGVNTVVYHGSTEAREIIQQYEFWHQEPYVPKPEAAALRKKGITKFNILLTTYDVVIKDSKILAKVPWKVLIVDEAHRLKNNTSRLFEELSIIPYDHCVLLTGTPLQNKTEELWSLLHFADKKRFKEREDFLSRFGNLTDAKQVAQLHNTLKPYLLRRVKEDVEKSLPPKEETIIEVALTPTQKQFYRAIYEKNTAFLFKGAKPSNAPSLMNVMMELRKCCNHPYLVRGVEERIISELPEQERTSARLHEQMIDCAGKMVLLDKLLPRLKEEGHKVLIFSQMVRVLDLLEDFLRFREFAYERLDGSARAADRNAAVDRFNDPMYNRYVMLLSTRAGGLGLNLTSADTVIIYDSDWNPQNDIQAQARAHRIGQTRAVMVYRLLTAKTYEMHMFHKASLKLGLDRAVLAHARHAEGARDGPRLKEPGKPDLQAKEIDELLKRGAYDIFREDDTEQKEFVEADIDSIMKRSAHKITYGGNGAASAPSLSSFSKASFVSTDQAEEVDIDDPDFWSKAVGLEEKPAPDDLFAEELPQQRRRRQTTMYDMDARNAELDYLDEEFDELIGDADFQSGEGAKASKEKKEKEKPAPKPREPKEWGSHSRDRLVRALTLYGFGRWHKIQRESGAHNRDVREVEAFGRACVMTWGLAAGEGEQPKNESPFVAESIEAAKELKQLAESGQGFKMPPVLEEERFFAKQKTGGARKSLLRLESLAKLTRIVMEALNACEQHAIKDREAGEAAAAAAAAAAQDGTANGAAEHKQAEDGDDDGSQVEGGEVSMDRDEDASGKSLLGKRGRSSPAPSSSTAVASAAAAENDIDEYFQRYSPSDIASRLPLGDFRPGWAKVAPWWDCKCDRHLLVGIFKHGFGRYSDLRNDPELCFHEKIREYTAGKTKPVTQVVGDSTFRFRATLSNGQDVFVQLPALRYSQFRGVYAQPGSTRWLAQYGTPEDNHYIGTYDQQTQAALAYDEEARKREGPLAICNFDIHGNRIPQTVADGTVLPLPWHRSSKYRGVRASGAKWTAQISYAGSNHHLGTFSTELEAAIAYDVAAREHHGPTAVVNFPSGIEEEIDALLTEDGVVVEYLAPDGSVEKRVAGGSGVTEQDVVAAAPARPSHESQAESQSQVETNMQLSQAQWQSQSQVEQQQDAEQQAAADASQALDDGDAAEGGDEEKPPGGDLVSMPDARTLNKLIGWLLTSPEARMSQADLERKQREQKRQRELLLAERREAKLKAAAAAAAAVEKKGVEKLGEHALLAQLSTLYDTDAVNAAHRMNCLRKLEKYLESNKQNGEAEENGSYPELGGAEATEESNGAKEDESGAEKAESEPDTTSTAKLTEDEVVRIVAVLVKHGAPITDANDGIPMSCVAALVGTVDDSAPEFMPEYSWEDVVAKSCVSRSAEEVEAFYTDSFLPFCGTICKVPKQLSVTSRVIFPQPYRRVNEHNLAAKGLCCMFLQRQQQLRALRFHVTRRFELLLQYLQSPAGRDVERVPEWWCPWMHDAAVVLGCLKYGYAAVEQICTDKTLPLTVQHVKQHTFRTFLLGSRDTLPAAFPVFAHREDAEQWLEAVTYLFPDKAEIESRLARLLVDMSKDLPNNHTMKVLRLGDEYDSDFASGQQAAAGAGGGAAAAAEDGAADGGAAMVKRPSRPLARFLWETAKRRRLAYVREAINGSVDV